MPKFREVVNNVLHDKEERGQDCINRLVDRNYELCNLKTGSKVGLDDVKALNIPRTDFKESMTDYCLLELAKHSVGLCSAYESQPKTLYTSSGINAENLANNIVKFVVSSPLNLAAENDRCQYVVKGIDHNKALQFDFSKFNTNYDGIKSEQFLSGSQEGLVITGIHLNGYDNPNFMVCVENYVEALNPSNFIFAAHDHSEL